GAEVVERDADADVAQGLERGDAAVAVLEHDALGDLEAQPLRSEPAGLERLRHSRDEAGLGELAGGDIDADDHLAVVEEADRLRARLAHDPRADRDDQAGLLGDRDEVGRRHHPGAGAVPADEGLDADDPAGRDGELGLEVDDELVVRDRLTQVGLDRLAGDGAVADDLVEHRPAAAAGLLGAVHGGVGVANEVGGLGVRVGRDRDADAAADERVTVLEREWLGQRLEQPLGDGDRVVRLGDVLAHEDELVAAEARGHLVAADGAAQALGDGEQEAVAGVVAETVVDDLEAVEVDEQDGDAAAAAVDAVERALEAAHEQQAARQPGERVTQELLLV